MSETVLLTIDKSMYEWLEEKRKLLRFRTIQAVIKGIIGMTIEQEEEGRIHDS